MAVPDHVLAKGALVEEVLHDLLHRRGRVLRRVGEDLQQQRHSQSHHVRCLFVRIGCECGSHTSERARIRVSQ